MTDNAPELAYIHDRSPVILEPHEWDAWLAIRCLPCRASIGRFLPIASSSRRPPTPGRREARPPNSRHCGAKRDRLTIEAFWAAVRPDSVKKDGKGTGDGTAAARI
ncbi:hypothetical protein ACLB0R_07060 [Sphingomonas sp. GlSt437]|uniref:hypothetical protein n=1 Tax=Sphingomonas sp. GlSt437 TaxID=3389970 RepID=UPI003A85DC37